MNNYYLYFNSYKNLWQVFQEHPIHYEDTLLFESKSQTEAEEVLENLEDTDNDFD